MNRKYYEAALLRMRSDAMSAYGEAEAILNGEAALDEGVDKTEALVSAVHKLLINENGSAVLENYFGQAVAAEETHKSLLLPKAKRFSILVDKLDVLISQTLPLVEKKTELTPERSANLRSSNKKQKIIDAAKKKQKAKK